MLISCSFTFCNQKQQVSCATDCFNWSCYMKNVDTCCSVKLLAQWRPNSDVEGGLLSTICYPQMALNNSWVRCPRPLWRAASIESEFSCVPIGSRVLQPPKKKMCLHRQSPGLINTNLSLLPDLQTWREWILWSKFCGWKKWNLFKSLTDLNSSL